MSDPATYQPFAYPDLRDPRVMLCVPKTERNAMRSLWNLTERLLTIVADAREPMLAQIKLAWWRDILMQLGKDADALPKGEPLLEDLRQDWAGSAEFANLANHVESLLLADDDDVAIDAAKAFGCLIWRLTGGETIDDAAGARWGMVAAGSIQPETPRAGQVWAQAARMPSPSGGGKGKNRALFMLDRWAQGIARRGGARSHRAETLLLLRTGLFGR